MKSKTPAPASYRELLGIPSAGALAAAGHGPADPVAAPHPTAPGRDIKGRVTKAPTEGEICAACGGTGRKGKS